MTPREAFKVGFLLRCADENLSDEETNGRIKMAAAMLEKQGLVPEAASGVANLGYGAGVLGLVGAAGLGGLAGYTHAKMTEPDVSVDEQKQRELTQAYQIQAQRARQAQARKGFRQKRPELLSNRDI